MEVDLSKVSLADLKQAKKLLEETLTTNIVSLEKTFNVKVCNCYYNTYSKEMQLEVKLPLSDEELERV